MHGTGTGTYFTICLPVVARTLALTCHWYRPLHPLTSFLLGSLKDDAPLLLPWQQWFRARLPVRGGGQEHDGGATLGPH